MYIGFRVKCRKFCQFLMQLEFFGQIFEKSSNMKFNENPSSGSRVVPFPRTDRHDETISLFRNFSKASKTSHLMLFTKIIVVCTEHHTEVSNASYRENVELLNVELGGTWCLIGLSSCCIVLLSGVKLRIWCQVRVKQKHSFFPPDFMMRMHLILDCVTLLVSCYFYRLTSKHSSQRPVIWNLILCFRRVREFAKRHC